MKVFSTLLTFTMLSSAQGQTVLDIVAGSADHTTLEAAVLAAPTDIATILSTSQEGITLFAPDDAAFTTSVPSDYLDTLLTAPYNPHLACVLTGHVYLGGAVPSSAITGPLSVDSATSGYMLNLNLNDASVTVNDISVAAADLDGTNGIVHSISGVLLPECVTVDIVTFLAGDPQFSTLVELVTAAGLVETLTTLTADGFTVLAPTNDAFAAVNADVLAYLGSNVTALTEVLTYHVIPSNTIMTGVTEGIFATVNGADVSVSDIMIDTADILVSNGIIQIISAVLIPPTLYLPELPLATPTEVESPTMAPAPTSSGFFVRVGNTLIAVGSILVGSML